jgi:quinoprotein glucose dehydrogenase
MQSYLRKSNLLQPRAANKLILFAVTLSLSIQAAAQNPRPRDGDWPAYGRDPGGSRYSPLTQINRENVKSLKLAWTYRTGDVSDGSHTESKSSFEATPILVDGTLYLSTAFNRVIALDPETGAERWSYDPKIDLQVHYDDGLISRGVSTWLDPQGGAGHTGRRRIFEATNDARLIALDAATGKPCADFGQDGTVDLKAGIGNFLMGRYHMTSPPAVIGDLVILGSAIGDNNRVEEASGLVRAFDCRTGRLRWKWDPIPREAADPARKTWAGDSASRTGAANVWSIISADPESDMVFLPTSSPSPDYFGGERKGANLYSDSLVALRASTGKLIWHFQVVHHDLWDYDIPAEPALITVHRNGRDIPAVAVATKMGLLFILDRETGKPLIPVEERPVPQGAVEGEELSPTQPFPTAPRPLAPHERITQDAAWGVTEAERDQCRDRIKSLRSDGAYTPPSLQGSIMYPGNIGGMHWGGVSFDAKRGLIVANTNHLAAVITLIPRKDFNEEKQRAWRAKDPTADLTAQRGTPYILSRGYLINQRFIPCTSPPFGTLAAVDVSTGAVRWEVPLGTMPELAGVPGSSGWGSLNFGGSIVTAGGLVFIGAARDNYLRAFNVETGEELWKAELPAGAQATPMTYTAGKNGKQYIVIAAGGHSGLHTKLGDYVVAFALP